MHVLMGWELSQRLPSIHPVSPISKYKHARDFFLSFSRTQTKNGNHPCSLVLNGPGTSQNQVTIIFRTKLMTYGLEMGLWLGIADLSRIKTCRQLTSLILKERIREDKEGENEPPCLKIFPRKLDSL